MLQDKQTNKSFHHFFCLQKTKKASDCLFSKALIIHVSRFNFPGASVYLFFLSILPENHTNGELGRKI